MPILNGLDVIRSLNSRKDPTPTIMITGAGDEEIAVEAMKSGASDYIVKDNDGRYLELMPYVLEHILNQKNIASEKKRVEEALKESERRYREHVETIGDIIYVLDSRRNFKFVNKALERLTGLNLNEMNNKNFLEIITPELHDTVSEIYENQINGNDNGTFEVELLARKESKRVFETREKVSYEDKKIIEIHGIGRDVTERNRAEEELSRSLERLQVTLDGTVGALAAAIDSRDPYTAGHQKRVAEIAVAIAREMSLSEEQVESIRMAGILHDIGKIRVPLEILSRPGRLLKTEIELIKEHPKIGYDIIKTIPFNGPVAEIVLQHHEAVDGSGYPSGTKGKDILMEARVIAVADAIEAMSTFRPYRPARGLDTAIEEIKKFSGVQYDPAVVDAATRLLTEKGFKLEE